MPTVRSADNNVVLGYNARRAERPETPIRSVLMPHYAAANVTRPYYQVPDCQRRLGSGIGLRVPLDSASMPSVTMTATRTAFICAIKTCRRCGIGFRRERLTIQSSITVSLRHGCEFSVACLKIRLSADVALPLRDSTLRRLACLYASTIHSQDAPPSSILSK